MIDNKKFRITSYEGIDSIPISWNLIPAEFIEKISRDCLVNVLYYDSSSGKLLEKTVVFISPVPKFTKGSTKIDLLGVTIEI